MGRKPYAKYKLFIHEGEKKREALEVQCDYCGKTFLKAKRFVKNGKKNFCCKECIYKSNVKPRIRLQCDYCGKTFERLEEKLKGSKSGYYFCSKKCKDLAQKIESGFIKMIPSHYNNGDYIDYRKVAFENYEHKCHVCGYNEHEELLQVHHIDTNRFNNIKENLVILCPTCHWSLTLKVAIINENRIYEWIGGNTCIH